MLYQPIAMKMCSKGDICINPRGAWLPATTAFFLKKNSRGKKLLGGVCRYCEKARLKIYRQSNAHQVYDKAYAQTEKHKEYQRAYQHSQKAKDIGKTRRQSSEYKKWRKEYSQTPEFKAQAKAYKKSDKGRIATNINTAKRRTRKRLLPVEYNLRDWQRALSYFGGRCAVCGRPPGLWHTLAQDHWIPLSSPDCPGTVPTNIVPLCHDKNGGAGGCNNNKSTRNAHEWLLERDRTNGTHQTLKIESRIRAYFDLIGSQAENQDDTPFEYSVNRP